jgi:uncharacterized protein YdeI (YjbR/CyaY-like superfamily)
MVFHGSGYLRREQTGLFTMAVDAINMKDSADWRRWLEENHDSRLEAWLVIYKKHSGKDGITYDEALEEALCFGWIDGKMQSLDGEKFVLRFSPRKANSVWSKINKEKAERLIKSGRMTGSGLAKIEEAKKSGLWEAAYTNRKRDEMPPDLESALMENNTAWLNFRKFANSYRNMYVGWVAGARTEATRRKRITEVVKRSALNRKPGIE